MCGIFGYFGSHGPKILLKMMENLQHRGPDAQGTLACETLGYGIGHTRLSIIDLSDRANQPMSDYSGDVDIVFNGEIYNYRLLKQTLIEKGYTFKSDSDTEVILNCYIEYGERCFDLFEGMFAVAIVDKRMVSAGDQPKFLLARDPFGIKPLHYTVVGETLYFASETRALRAVLGSSLQIDTQSLQSFLSIGSVVQPMTIDKRIMSLRPGSFAVWLNKRVETTSYWDLHLNSQPVDGLALSRTEQENVEEIESRLLNAISISTASDTPVALMLSGGIDSVSIATLLKRNQIVDFESFFLRGFTSGQNDESNVVKDVAANLGIKVNVMTPSENIADSFFSWIRDMDQPSIDGFNVWLLSREISKTHKVAFTGAGGDEVFAGYPHHRIAKFLQRRRSCFPFDPVLAMINNIRPNRYSLSLINRLGSPGLIWRSARNLKKESRNIVADDSLPRFGQFESEDEVQCLQRLDLERYLVNTILADQDIVSMAHGLELRPSYLNKKLVEYAYRVPSSQKINLRINKPLLVKAVNDPVVKSIGHMEKRGFELPYVVWMKNQLKTEFISLVSSLDRDLIDSRIIDYELLKLHQSKPDAFTWALGVLSAWLIENRR